MNLMKESPDYFLLTSVSTSQWHSFYDSRQNTEKWNIDKFLLIIMEKDFIFTFGGQIISGNCS